MMGYKISTRGWQNVRHFLCDSQTPRDCQVCSVGYPLMMQGRQLVHSPWNGSLMRNYRFWFILPLRLGSTFLCLGTPHALPKHRRHPLQALPTLLGESSLCNLIYRLINFLGTRIMYQLALYKHCRMPGTTSHSKGTWQINKCKLDSPWTNFM